ncbi:PleD family two-component system response regulator [Ponticaulis profundi]|uniref:diguanylate cyclase n=1 Tax=Ponticaulis profundi TaxID=2665222 RepID=A0ABW1SDJ2_9PROT
MSAHVLVADDILANRKLLQAKLSHEYFQVSTACNGQEAVDLARALQPDIILLDVMMPVMDGFEACEILKADRSTQHIPIVMVTALGDREHRLKGLSAGADDFLTKPVDDFALLSRVRALTKYKLVMDELRSREASGRRMGVIEGDDPNGQMSPARILIVDDNERQARRISLALKDDHLPMTIQEAGGLSGNKNTGIDLLILSLESKSFDPLRICAHFKTAIGTRDLPILVIADFEDEARGMRALELGASDIIMRPIDTEELSARVKTQVRKKRYVDAMRRRLDESMELAITDQLTGLYNRRHMLNQLGQFLNRANRGDGPLSVFIADIDHFKSVNDTYGHDVGDEVLKQFAERMRENVRPADIPCRQGGEEFVVIMPNTAGDVASSVAERVRRHVCGEPFRIDSGKGRLDVTVSLGVATTLSAGETEDDVIKRADEALYEAKHAGRNQVKSRAA